VVLWTIPILGVTVVAAFNAYGADARGRGLGDAAARDRRTTQEPCIEDLRRASVWRD
jgi:hypothetical protein